MNTDSAVPIDDATAEPGPGVAGRARGCRWSVRYSCCALLVLVTALPTAASAYTVQTPVTDGCHEALTSEAWKSARAELPEATAPLPSQGDDQALIEDVTFDLPVSMRDIGAVTLLLGVRYPDLRGYGPLDLKSLAPAAARPEEQAAHCLRSPAQDEPDGSRQAVSSCRAFIRQHLLAAADGLGADGRPDGTQRSELKVSLAIRGEIDVNIPTFYLNSGLALHALQDSFTHTFREPDDPKRITVVLNFAELVEDELDEARDGPPHLQELDRCDNPDDLRAERRSLAVAASRAALLAVLTPADRASKERQIDEVLDEYVAWSTDSHCKSENGWCNAPELAYRPGACSCRGAGNARSSGWSLALGIAGAAALARARRRHARWRRGAVACLCLITLLRTKSAQAREPAANGTPAAQASDWQVPRRVDDGVGELFGRISLGASYDNAALSGGAGLRYRMSPSWLLGLDAEWNPYIARTSGMFRPGSLNAYASLSRRFRLHAEGVNLRTTLALGGSMLLFDLVGAARYDLGPFAGISFLGIEWELSKGCYVTLDPTFIALPIPHVSGIPFMYAQYRFLGGLEWGG